MANAYRLKYDIYNERSLLQCTSQKLSIVR